MDAPTATVDSRPYALAADDDPDLRLLVATRLEELGYRVAVAGDGEEALDVAARLHPELAVLDVAMPRRDGVEVTRLLRGDPEHKDLAVILLTARTGEEDIARGYEAGAVDYLKKPFSPREFQEAVRRVEAERAESRAHWQARRLAETEAALARVASAVAADATPRDIFAMVCHETATITGAAGARICRFVGGMNARVVGAWRRPPGRPAEVGTEVSLDGSGAMSGVHASGTPARVDIPGSARPHRLAVPITVGGQTWGGLAVASGTPQTLDDPYTVEQLTRFAHLVGLALVNAEARAQLATMASTDHLTGLPNQRMFHERLAQEFRRAQRHRRDLSLVVFDIDHFKRVNDEHGHDVGNVVLTELARRLTEATRAGEMMARAGGEEFAWILPETSAQGAVDAAERVRRSIRGTPFPVVGRLTISAGVSGLDDADHAADLFRFADAALYRAKRGGRDRVCRYTELLGDSQGDVPAARLRERVTALAGLTALARAADALDPHTHGHSERVANLAAALAAAVGWTPQRAALLRQAGLVHDIGKMGVPHHILRKHGPLDPDEYEYVKAHAAVGADLATGILTDEQAAWVRGHHERHDGAGYPDGLDADFIPVGAQLLAVADAWDTMTTRQGYRDARSTDAALAEFRAQAGRQFSPGAVAALEAVITAGWPPPVPKGQAENASADPSAPRRAMTA